MTQHRLASLKPVPPPADCRGIPDRIDLIQTEECIENLGLSKDVQDRIHANGAQQARTEGESQKKILVLRFLILNFNFEAC